MLAAVKSGAEKLSMNSQALATLEQAAEPYRCAGFIITSQSEGMTTLIYPQAKFNYLLFIVLLLVWPLAVLYLISFNNRPERKVYLRVNAQGRIEEGGYTLVAAERDRKHEQLINSIILVVLIITLIVLIFLVLHLT